MVQNSTYPDRYSSSLSTELELSIDSKTIGQDAETNAQTLHCELFVRTGLAQDAVFAVDVVRFCGSNVEQQTTTYNLYDNQFKDHVIMARLLLASDRSDV